MKKLNVNVKKAFGTILSVLVSVAVFFMIAFTMNEGINLLASYSDTIWIWWNLNDTSTYVMYLLSMAPAFLVYDKLIRAADENL